MFRLHSLFFNKSLHKTWIFTCQKGPSGLVFWFPTHPFSKPSASPCWAEVPNPKGKKMLSWPQRLKAFFTQTLVESTRRLVDSLVFRQDTDECAFLRDGELGHVGTLVDAQNSQTNQETPSLMELMSQFSPLDEKCPKISMFFVPLEPQKTPMTPINQNTKITHQKWHQKCQVTMAAKAHKTSKSSEVKKDASDKPGTTRAWPWGIFPRNWKNLKINGWPIEKHHLVIRFLQFFTGDIQNSK